MPHINRIRVNNVKYNFGTQFYDDFLMRFSCKNTIYDLANGGGKSVLMLLLLQNLIPNCTLDDKQPVEKLFRTNEGSTTIHSMIEWSLSDVHIKDGFKYMLTGFCARKAKDISDTEENNESNQAVRSGTSIEYFNYCIFYRTFNDNDIKNFPLSQNGERVTYNGLKNYLKDLQKNDYNLEVKIFERKGDYQRFIAEYGLYESEWEIIRGINRTEGHVRTYFETNYKTTRKVVEDLLIEEIIEKSFVNKYSDENGKDNLAETLLNIKDKLLELSEKKEEINNYDRQIEIINGFAERVSSVKQLYKGIENAFIRLKKANNSLADETVMNQKNLEQVIEEKESVVADKNQLEKKIETAKVLVNIKELDRIKEKLETENERFAALEEEMQEINQQLNIYEGGNYYLEYIECKKDYDKLKHVMDNLLKDNNTLIKDLKRLVAAKKIYDENREIQLTKEIEREMAVQAKESDNLKILQDNNKEADNKSAILAYQLEVCEKDLNVTDKEIAELKNSVSLLLPTEAKQLYKNNTKRIEELKTIIEEKESDKKSTDDAIISLQLDIQQKKYELESLLKEKESLYEKNGNILNDYEKISKIKQVYGEEDISKLIVNVEKIYKNMILADDEIFKQIKNTEKLLKSLEAGKVSLESSQLENVLDYIRRYHSAKAVSGIEYIGTLSDSDRVTMVKECPVLAHALIVYDNFWQIVTDNRIKSMLKEGGSVPVINGEELESGELSEIFPLNKISYITYNAEEYTSSRITARIENLKKELQELNKKYIRQCENEQVVHEDYIFLCRLADRGITDEELNPSTAIDKIENDIVKINQNIEKYTENMQEEEKKKDSLILEIKSAEEEMYSITEESNILKNIIELLDKRYETERRLECCKSEKIALERELNDGRKRYEALLNMNNQRNIRISSMKKELQELEDMWDKNYKSYFDENIYNNIADNEEIKNKLLTDNLNVELQAVLESIRRDNYAVADKEKLLANYQVSMQRSLEHIDYMGVDIKIFQNMYSNNELVKTTSEELWDIKHKINECKDREKHLRRQLQITRSSRDKLQGEINHAISVINEKYGEFREELIADSEIDTFINDNDAILSELENRDNVLAKDIKKYENRAAALEVLKRDVAKLMAKSEVKPDASVGVFASDTDVEKECREIAEQLDSFIEEKYKRGESFEKDMYMLNDTLKKLNAHELASEIRMNVSMPSDLKETEDLIDMLCETTQYIELEKQRIIKGLDDIQIIKDNFENQCIQSCINIKTELDRLSKLSKITMEGENISIINLKIPYVKEETYKERMSDYIDRIAKGTDNFENGDDKLKYIRNNLCWKKMFSVIVSDMNGIRLNLYKRERIADQSRYLPYEDAVGSTGQSQGIYIQFLVAIINYISGINSRNADSSRLKKVVFIDNPFGAAKDVYIWEPIFKLLKTNNVQLIVPARGATPAITGRFDVNYVLGQKMCNGRQQTVVVDYFSNVNSEELDYTTISYEQAELF